MVNMSLPKTPEEQLALAKINPELDQIIKSSPPIQGLDSNVSIQALRATLLARKQELTAANTSTSPVTYKEQDIQIIVRDASTIAIRIHSPKIPVEDGSPLLVMYHGGGYCLGGLENEAVVCRGFAERGGVAVNVDYRLAPEYKFPKGLEDAYDALKWTVANLKDLNGNPKKGFLVGGVSAGANFAAVIAHLYRDEKSPSDPPLTGQYLSIPAVLEPDAVPEELKKYYLSREQNKDAPILNAGAIELFEKNYQPTPNSPLKSPFLFPSHKDLPPAYFQICGMDPLRDEAIIYERALREENGIKTKVDFFPGLPHGFWSWLPTAKFSLDFQKDSVEGFKWLLESD